MPRSTRRSLVLLLMIGIGLVPFMGTAAEADAQDTTRVDSLGIKRLGDGVFTLARSAGAAPHLFGSYARYGLFLGSPQPLADAAVGAQITYSAEAPTGTSVLFAVRGQTLGQRWSPWMDGATGSSVHFDEPVQTLQYRVMLFGTQHAQPVIQKITVAPISADIGVKRVAEARVAPTYRLRVTREGMVGSHTANGHRIRRNDVYVSLPSWSVLSSLGGDEYAVRLSANGNSVIAPVWDVGPWNHHDNFWDKHRQTYKDLPTGWPEDHAAYYERYHHRMADEGWVRFPSAVDIGDGAYWALDLEGEQAVVNVTFLWLGSDPGPNPDPLNSRPSRRPPVEQTSQNGD
ncbi:MAG: hypothetical protein NVS4B8_18440 [Herpetosiphon sp.]